MQEPRLIHADDTMPGISRRRSGRGFCFHDSDGNLICDREEKQRLRSLAIPPAWREVWICADPRGHIQVTGFDDRGRKQYIYHPDWLAWRNATKFARVLDFAAALPRLRKRMQADLRRRALKEELVLAATVRILQQTLIRVGNRRYATENRSYGLTTLRRRHLSFNGSGEVKFSFRGKSGKYFEARLTDRRVATILRRLEGLPGQDLFQFVNGDGVVRRVASDDVNAYIRETAGGEFSTKDFRTWAATVLTAGELALAEPAASEPAARSIIKRAVQKAARRLGNTVAVCRRSYVHPQVIEGYVDGSIHRIARRIASGSPEEPPVDGLTERESAVLSYLKQHDGDGVGRKARRLSATG